MELVTIFGEHLRSVKYDTHTEDEFNRLFHQWNDMTYLEAFLHQNSNLLKQHYWREHGNHGIISASMTIFDEAQDLQDWFLTLYENSTKGKSPDFETQFKPLSKQDENNVELTRTKSYGMGSPSMLRLYALRIEPNVFVLTGGAIKLTRTMQECPYLVEELHKMKRVKNWLQANNIEL